MRLVEDEMSKIDAISRSVSSRLHNTLLKEPSPSLHTTVFSRDNSMSKKALFVIDTQAELVSIPSTAIPHAAHICEVGGVILDRARRIPSTELEIIVVQHCEDASDPNATLIPGSKEWELALPPQEGVKNERVVRKTTG